MAIYSIGYSGWKLKDLVQYAANLDAWIVDVRLRPFSRNPEFNRDNIKEAYPKYIHVEGLGNRNYKGGPIELKDPEPHWQKIMKHLADGENIILLCMCKNPVECHRTTTVRALIEKHGLPEAQVIEVNAPQKNSHQANLW